MELITAIALLCQLHGSTISGEIAKHQLKCQKYYMKCIKIGITPHYTMLNIKKCTLNRAIK